MCLYDGMFALYLACSCSGVNFCVCFTDGHACLCVLCVVWVFMLEVCACMVGVCLG